MSTPNKKNSGTTAAKPSDKKTDAKETSSKKDDAKKTEKNPKK